MSNNAAIVVAVSDYQDPNNSLPGCTQDGQIIKTLLDTTGKYNELLFINENTESIKVKEKLSEFVSTHKGKVFDEVFFYYTGHGDFRGEEFNYILSDFDESKYRQTSLVNSELDTFLKQLNPKLTIKIVDACHSGVSYIKSNDILNKYLNTSKESFKKCYFMFSSMSNQSSYQSELISDFTKVFVKSVTESRSNNLRYKDIVDFISDEFERNTLQKPFFVNQADFTEVFCLIDDQLRNKMQIEIKKLLVNEPEYHKNKELSLVDLVINDAKRYCDEPEALERINCLKKIVEEYRHSAEIHKLYEVKKSFEQEYTSISSHYSSIGKWLEKNENNYFAKPIYERELIEKYAPEQLFLGISQLINPVIEKKYKTIIKGYELTTESQFYIIKVDAKPKYPNIDWRDCKIAFVFSQITIRFFYYFANFKLKNWDEYSHNSTANWQTVEVELKDEKELRETIHNILRKFDSFILDPLRTKYVSTLEDDKVEENNKEEE